MRRIREKRKEKGKRENRGRRWGWGDCFYLFIYFNIFIYKNDVEDDVAADVRECITLIKKVFKILLFRRFRGSDNKYVSRGVQLT